jgi:hypothetical protein
MGEKIKSLQGKFPGGFIMALSGKPASKIPCFEHKCQIFIV